MIFMEIFFGWFFIPMKSACETSHNHPIFPWSVPRYARVGLMGNPSDGFHGKVGGSGCGLLNGDISK